MPVEPLLAGAGIAPTARAEELSVADFCALARGLKAAAAQRMPLTRPASCLTKSARPSWRVRRSRSAVTIACDLGDAVVEVALTMT